MENNNNSYAESGDSSPRSRDIDSENPSWDEQQQQQQSSNYRVKFMCSYGGKIQPRPHDNQLTYFGGDTKILAVDRTIKFLEIMSKLSALCDSNIVFKYQLPGEDLDALISVTNDEDLEHMMVEYDRVHRISPKPQRLRLFLFLQKNLAAPKNYDSNESKPNQQWLDDSLNSVPIQSLDSSPVEAPSTQDFLFGFDKCGVRTGIGAVIEANIAHPVAKLTELEIQGGFPANISARSESTIDDRSVGESVISPVEIQRQIHELQKLQIANQEQAMFKKNSDDALARAFHGDYYAQNVQEKASPVVAPATVATQPAYWQDMNGGGYTTGNEHPVYLIPSPAGMQPVTGPLPTGMYQATTNVQPVTQGYYAMQRVQQQPEVYREQPVFTVGPPPPPQHKIIARPGVGGGMETGYTQVAYDSAGRQVYYTAAPGNVVMPSSLMPSTYHQTIVSTGGVDLRQVAPLNAISQEGKVATSAAG